MIDDQVGGQKICLGRCVLVHRWLVMSDSLDCSLPGTSVHGIAQARILELVAISSSGGSSWPRDWTWVSCIGRQILYHHATWEATHTYIIYTYAYTYTHINWYIFILVLKPVLLIGKHYKCFFFLLSLIYFLLKDNCFTEFCCFLSNLNMNQP